MQSIALTAISLFCPSCSGVFDCPAGYSYFNRLGRVDSFAIRNHVAPAEEPLVWCRTTFMFRPTGVNVPLTPDLANYLDLFFGRSPGNASRIDGAFIAPKNPSAGAVSY